jgi:thiol-disulfide isomerase/thioredoxin
MVLIGRRRILAAAGTLAAGLGARKLRAADLYDVAAALKPTQPPVDASGIVFVSADGTEHRLAEFRGHGMMVNLWATWCAPCVEEMPSLAKLSKALAPDDIAVLPLSSDRGGANVVEAYFHDNRITGLPVLLDPKSAAVRASHASGIPTSLIIDKQVREVARLEGSADWSTPEAAEIVRRLVG